MKESLKQKLHKYIVAQNPELLLKLQAEFSVTNYINDKVQLAMEKIEGWLADGVAAYEIEEMALREMTAELRPSRFLYLKEVLETEFPKEYNQYLEAGVLTYELVNMIEKCADDFVAFEFAEGNGDNRFLRYAIIARLHDYLP